MEEIREILRTIQEQFRQMNRRELLPGTDWPQVLRFQGHTIQYGMAAAEFEISWYRRLLHELEGPS